MVFATGDRKNGGLNRIGHCIRTGWLGCGAIQFINGDRLISIQQPRKIKKSVRLQNS
ncbi:hypothetical protein [Leptolyngbya ohadii]|uniref:hypothetical protein n=1 Tax=Leptolyngbya ohadii TaxID=1962290 RepID=UPI0015C5DDD5|nr:hypothetical protein [Leptolyngbya ohadii]